MKHLTPESAVIEPAGADGNIDIPFAFSQAQIKVHQVMTPQVMTVHAETTMAQTAAQMAGQGISCAVVIEGHRVLGMLTHKDFLYGLAAHGQHLYERTAADQMSTPVCTVHPECSILNSCRFMDQEHIRRLPVLDGDTLVGIVTQTDLTRALTSYGVFREVSEIMTPTVVTVHIDDTLDVALANMAQHRISCTVVLCGEHTVGILTERDILSKITARQVDPRRIRVEDVMSSPLTHIESHLSIHSAARMMDQYHFHRLVVVDEGKLQGVVTQSDIFRAAHQELKQIQDRIGQTQCPTGGESMVAGMAQAAYAPMEGAILSFQNLEQCTERLQEVFMFCEGLAAAVKDGREEKVQELLAGIHHQCGPDIDSVREDLVRRLHESHEALACVTHAFRNLQACAGGDPMQSSAACHGHASH